QGTVGLEIMQDRLDLDAVVVPVGGGGLITGIAIAVKTMNPQIQVIGVQPANIPSMAESLRRGHRVSLEGRATIAHGLAVKTPGSLTFELVKRWVDDILTVSEEEIAYAMLLLLERNKLLVEGAGAAGVAALLKPDFPVKGKKVGVVV